MRDTVLYGSHLQGFGVKVKRRSSGTSKQAVAACSSCTATGMFYIASDQRRLNEIRFPIMSPWGLTSEMT